MAQIVADADPGDFVHAQWFSQEQAKQKDSAAIAADANSTTAADQNAAELCAKAKLP